MQINRKTIRASSAVRLFVGNVWLTSVALRSSSENIRTSENLRELFNRYELTKNILLKIPAEFLIPGFPAYPVIFVFILWLLLWLCF